MLQIYRREYYSTLKNDTIKYAGKCMELAKIILNKVIQTNIVYNHLYLDINY